MSRGAIAIIDRAALRHNFCILRKYAPNTSVLAMIKSNGYGHGLITVAKELQAADALGVACVEEALCLREAGIRTPLVIMAGFLDYEELQFFSHYDIQAVIHQESQVELLEKNPLLKPLCIWLKIDTGMNRLGFPIDKVPEIYQRLQKLTHIQKPIRLMTHLANADQDPIYTEQQIRHFLQVTANYVGPKSITNSAGILHFSQAHCDWVRPGIMLYGVSPFADQTGEMLGLQPVMTLQAKLIAKNFVKKGSSIGYGCTWRCPEDMPVGVIAIGYGDGYPRHAKSGTPILIRNVICPLLGRVSMDMINVDLRALPEAQIGDVATLWGKGLPIEAVAKYADTISYELLCNVTQRVKYVSSS